MSVRLLVSLFAGAAVTLGRLSDPLIAHVFQWTAYQKRFGHLVEPGNSRGVEQPEALRVPLRDGCALMTVGMTTTDCHLMMVALRNFVNSSVAKEFSFHKGNRDVEMGMKLASKAIVKLVDALKAAAFGHFVAVMTSLDTVPSVEDRLLVQKGFIEFHAFLTGVINARQHFHSFQGFDHFSWSMQELSGVASLSARAVKLLPDPLKQILSRLVRLVLHWRHVPLLRPDQKHSKILRNFPDMHRLFDSEIYARLTRDCGLQFVGVTDLHDEKGWIEEFFGISMNKNIIELVNSPFDLGLDASILRALTEALHSAEALFDAREHDLSVNARAVVQMADTVALVLIHGNLKSQILLDALRADFYRMAVVFCSRMTSRIPDVPGLQALSSPVNHFFAGLVGRLSSNRRDLTWTISGDPEMKRLLIAALVPYTKAINMATRSDARALLTNIKNALETFKAIFYR